MSSAKLKVVVVDHDPSYLRELAQWLSEADYEVAATASGAEALAAVTRNSPHFLVAGWQLGDMLGLDLCRQARELQLPNYVHVTLVTPQQGGDDVVTGVAAGADDFVHRAASRDEVLARLRSAGRVLELERRLRKLARTDALTNISSKTTLEERFAAEWSRSRRYRLPLSCVMFDIDGLAQINAGGGHALGDAVLRSVAELLVKACRTSDFICRWEGDAFCAVLPETSEAHALVWANRLRKTIAETPLHLAGQVLNITASFGVAQRLDDTPGPSELLDLAEQTLLIAQQMATNYAQSYGGLTSAPAPRSTQLAAHSALLEGVRAKDVMTPLVTCIGQETTVARAARFFLEERLSSAPVVDEAGKLAGIVSEKDLIQVMQCPDSWARPVREVMRRQVVCYEEDTAAPTIYEFLCRVSIRRVVIVKSGYPTGVVSRANLLQWFSGAALAQAWSASEHAARLIPDERARGSLLTHTAAELQAQTTALHADLAAEGDDPARLVLGAATRIETLLADLLGQSSYQPPTVPPVDPRATLARTNDRDEPTAWIPPGCVPEFLSDGCAHDSLS